MKHNFISAKSEGTDPTLVGPNEWNDTHVYAISSISVNTMLSNNNNLVLATGGSLGITITLPTAIGNTGRSFILKKIDSGAGQILISPFGTQTVDNNSSGYVLDNQFQVVEITSDGSNWWVVRASSN